MRRERLRAGRAAGFLALIAAAALGRAESSGYRYAIAPRAFHFPRDHGSHPDYRVEWWYYTGNLSAGRRAFGYQLTWFRVGVDPAWRASHSAWAPRDVMFAHLALSDVASTRYRFHERILRPALGMAGADTTTLAVWLDDWSVALEPDGRTQRLRASASDFALDLRLEPRKAPVAHGLAGLSRKSAAVGNASYYYSFTRLATSGRIRAGADSFTVGGDSWMDHEFSTSSLDSSQVGWDWFSIQLDTNQELMLYQLRRRDGTIEPFSSGTWIGSDGRGAHLPRDAFTIQITRRWKSPHSGADYPHGWHIQVPSRGADLVVSPALDDQELTADATGGLVYWEGCVRVRGTLRGAPVTGRGYVELTGYAGAAPGLGASR